MILRIRGSFPVGRPPAALILYTNRDTPNRHRAAVRRKDCCRSIWQQAVGGFVLGRTHFWHGFSSTADPHPMILVRPLSLDELVWAQLLLEDVRTFFRKVRHRRS
jgi:hypothetical protein